MYKTHQKVKKEEKESLSRQKARRRDGKKKVRERRVYVSITGPPDSSHHWLCLSSRAATWRVGVVFK